MELTWFGTAGFLCRTGRTRFYIDPFLTRNNEASPALTRPLSEMETASEIFISHGHFDHIMDIPKIVDHTRARIFCSDEVAASLTAFGTDTGQIRTVSGHRTSLEFEDYTAEAFFSRHVRFDPKLVVSTLLKINVRLFELLPLFRRFPCGQVLSWRFSLEGKTLQFFGSAGSTRKELEEIAQMPTDILLVPLQGHSDICHIALDYVRLLKPKIVVPHHHDDFFPPISQRVDINPFLDGMKTEFPHIEVRIPRINTPGTF